MEWIDLRSLGSLKFMDTPSYKERHNYEIWSVYHLAKQHCKGLKWIDYMDAIGYTGVW